MLLPLLALLYLAATRQGIMASGTPVPSPPVAAPAGQAPAALPTAIAWTGSLDWALQTARTTNKPIMVDFYADW